MEDMTIEIVYTQLKEINTELFSAFDRYQEVKKCWRKADGKWILKDIAFIEQWNKEDYETLVLCLKNTVDTGGVVFGVLCKNTLVGFASLENELFGSHDQYLQLSSLHVSNGMRKKGIGRDLFHISCEKAKELGAKKLYISAHSSRETRAFYNTVGCVEALEYNNGLVIKEPFDCQLEYDLYKL